MTFVFDFDAIHEAAGADLARLLGGKGAELHLMVAELRLPVPPGFTIGTDACNAYLGAGWPAGLDTEVREHMAALERRVGRRFGDADDPLLVSVRSGAPVSMPGMMDTILDLGLNDQTTSALASVTGNADFADDCRRRFGEMYRRTVGVEDVPDDPWLQLRAAIEAVFRSWNGDRARAYRRREGIADDLGTAVTVQAMVFGNRDADSGSGVLFTRDPATGAHRLYGDVMFAAQGEDVVAGTHRTADLAQLASRLPQVAADLQRYAELLERHHADMCDIEFTFESGRLWLLQCRVGRRSPQAALRMAVEMAEEPDFPLTREQAVARVAPLLADPPHPIGRPAGDPPPIANGLPASPGLASGEIATTADAAVAAAAAGRQVILVRAETSPRDVHGMARASGLLTARGGLASHAAVVARGWGIPAVVGASELTVHDHAAVIAGREYAAGSWLSIDGSTGRVYEGVVAGTSAPLPEVAALRGWAAELDVEIGPEGTSAGSGAPGAALSAPSASPSPDALISMLAIRGFATPEGLAEALFATPGAVIRQLDRLIADGLLEAVGESFRLATPGQAAADRIFAADRESWGVRRAIAALDAFVDLDRTVKQLVTDWQLRPEGGTQTLNDHSDPGYDREVLARLRSIHDRAAGWLVSHATSVARLDLYRLRLARALERAEDGDARYVASPRVDSYHSAWFELHEELIRLCGRSREEEVAAGRA